MFIVKTNLLSKQTNIEVNEIREFIFPFNNRRNIDANSAALAQRETKTLAQRKELERLRLHYIEREERAHSSVQPNQVCVE